MIVWVAGVVQLWNITTVSCMPEVMVGHQENVSLVVFVATRVTIVLGVRIAILAYIVALIVRKTRTLVRGVGG